MKLRLLLPAVGLLLVAAVVPAPVDELARAKELLKGFEGNWESEMSFMGMTSKGSEQVKLVSGGTVAIVEASGAMGPGQTFEGWGMIGYDPADKVWRHIWCDNQGPGLAAAEGTWSADGKTFTIEDEMDFNMGSGPQRMVMTSLMTGPDTREGRMIPKDAPAGAPPMMTIKYKRHAP
jgi:hypothetical protein